jgi:hypothetical protein
VGYCDINTKIRYGISTINNYEHVSARERQNCGNTSMANWCNKTFERWVVAPAARATVSLLARWPWQMVTVDGPSVGPRRRVMDTEMMRSAWNIQ